MATFCAGKLTMPEGLPVLTDPAYKDDDIRCTAILWLRQYHQSGFSMRSATQSSLKHRSQESPPFIAPTRDKNWYAIYTAHKHETSVMRHLEIRAVEAFFPTYEVNRLWRNRQRVKVHVPLFPSYLFVRTGGMDYVRVLQCPGVVRLIGNHAGPLPIEESVIELLRVNVAEKKIEPYRELVVGERVRIKSGILRGIEGTLVHRDSGWKFVLTLDSINQHASIKMEAENLELVRGGT